MLSGHDLLSITEEAKIVALLARGDTYDQIQAQMERSVAKMTIGRVKKRNKGTLDMISAKAMQKAEADAASIKNKANTLISTRLDRADKFDKLIEKLESDYVDGNITYKEYREERRKLKDVTLPELVIVSKEMHHQTSAEPTPPANQQDIATLIAAIKSGDEVKLNQIIFNGGDNASSQPPPA